MNIETKHSPLPWEAEAPSLVVLDAYGNVVKRRAFVALKALAFHLREENKDAYDLFYLLRNYGRGVSDVAAELRRLLADASAVKAMEYLRSDFANSDAIGPSRTAEFLYGRTDAAIQADAAGFVRQLLAECRK